MSPVGANHQNCCEHCPTARSSDDEQQQQIDFTTLATILDESSSGASCATSGAT